MINVIKITVLTVEIDFIFSRQFYSKRVQKCLSIFKLMVILLSQTFSVIPIIPVIEVLEQLTGGSFFESCE